MRKNVVMMKIVVVAIVIALMVVPVPAVGAGDGACDWTGTWDTNWGEMVLSQAGTQVSGSYTHDAGRITGTLSGSTLIGTWSEAPSYSPSNDSGDVQLTIAADCNSFTGIWGYGSSGDWSGDWTGTRTGAAPTIDSDGDGVPDDKDQCDGTPAGVAVDDKGCPPCVADFRCSPRTGVAPMSVECFDYSYESPVSWTWDFGDGTTSTEQNPVHIYTVPGRYVITLRVECASGVIDTLETYVDVELLTDEEECRADFLIEQNRCRFQFFDISQGDPVEWQWDFGDSFAGEGADTSRAQNPAYGYLYSSDNAPDGSYQVTLTIRCRDGNESSISKYVQCEKGNQSINCSWDAPSSCSQWNRSSTPDYAKVLFLTDPPGATIFIDGYSNPCTTPAVVQFLDEGTYNIRIFDCGGPLDIFDIISVVHGDVYCREYTLRCRGGPHVGQESPQKPPSTQRVCASAKPSITSGGEFTPATFIIGGTEPQKVSITLHADNFDIVAIPAMKVVYRVTKGKSSGSLTLEPGTYRLSCGGGGVAYLESATVCIEYPVVTGTPPAPTP